jgi:hypothetical protein
MGHPLSWLGLSRLGLSRRSPDGADAKGSRLIAAAALAGVIIGASLGYFYTSAEPAAVPSSAAAAPGPSLDDAISLLRNGETPPERLYLAGIELRDSPGGSRDVAVQAIRRAADLGYAQAQLWLAQAADPSRQEWARVSSKPDAARALELYEHAQQTGAPEARRLRAALCDYLRGAPQLTDADRLARTNHCY